MLQYSSRLLAQYRKTYIDSFCNLKRLADAYKGRTAFYLIRRFAALVLSELTVSAVK